MFSVFMFSSALMTQMQTAWSGWIVSININMYVINYSYSKLVEMFNPERRTQIMPSLPVCIC